jgi:polyhydroxyalkanoate synthesis regulator phasin
MKALNKHKSEVELQTKTAGYQTDCSSEPPHQHRQGLAPPALSLVGGRTGSLAPERAEKHTHTLSFCLMATFRLASSPEELAALKAAGIDEVLRRAEAALSAASEEIEKVQAEARLERVNLEQQLNELEQSYVLTRREADAARFELTHLREELANMRNERETLGINDFFSPLSVSAFVSTLFFCMIFPAILVRWCETLLCFLFFFF